MKLPELKNRFMGKYMIKIVAGVLTVALLGSSLTAVAVQADQNEKAEVKTKTVEETDTELHTDTCYCFERESQKQ